MNDKEAELIGRLQSGIKYGPNSCIHRPKPESKPSEKVDRVEQLVQSVRRAKDMTKKKDNGEYEMVNHPKHYNNYDVEVVDMMEKIWGTKATMEWCKMTAYKYRMRMGTKPAEDDTREAMQKKLMEDFNKEQWYLAKAKELSSKLSH